MGRYHKPLSCLTGGKTGKIFFLFLLFLPLLPLMAQQGTGAHAAIRGFALPEYRKKDNRLQFILYGEKAVNLGAMVELENLTLDIVRDNVKNIQDVIPLNEVPLYPLSTPLEKVEEFWRSKKHCHALIRTGQARYDKNAKVIRGEGPIHFRSRQIDIKGIGFDAFYKTRLIHIRSGVKVILRPFWREESADNTIKNPTKNKK